MTLAEALKEIGYKTSLFTERGAIEDHNLAQGFDVIRRYERDKLKVVDVGAAFAEEGKKFIFIHLNGAHEPYICGEPYDSMFDPGYAGSTLSYEEFVSKTDYSGRLHPWSVFLASADGHTVDEIIANPAAFAEYNTNVTRSGRKVKDHDHVVALYDGKIRRTDDIIRHVLSDIQSYGLMDNSVVVLFSDHGEEFFEHGSYGHRGYPYEELTHVTLIISVPNTRGDRIQSTVRLADVMPTILDLVSIETPPQLREQMEGESLLGVMEGREVSRLAFSEADGSTVSIRMPDGYLYIYWMETNSGELYKLPDDVNAVTNTRPEKAEELKKKLFKYMGYY